MSRERAAELPPMFFEEKGKDGNTAERSSQDYGRERENEYLSIKRPEEAVKPTQTLSPGLQSRAEPLRPITIDEGMFESGLRERHGSQRSPLVVDYGQRVSRRPSVRESIRDRRGYDYDDRYDDEYEDYDPQYRRAPRGYGYDRREDVSEDLRRLVRSSRLPEDYYDRPRRMRGTWDGSRMPPRQHYDGRSRQARPAVIEDEEDIMGPQKPSPPIGPTVDFKNLTHEEKKEVLRLPWMQWMNSDLKNHTVATLGEFIGTTMFLFFAFAGTQVANIGSGNSADNSTSGGATGFNPTVLLYIAIVFGFSLMVNVWVFFRISGGLFNPAVTLAMVLVSALSPIRAVCLLVAQVAGGIAASALVSVLFPTALNVRTTLAGGTSLVQGVFIELILTAELVFTIFMLAKEKHRATFMAPVGIGLALFVAELVGVFYTGGSLNPARSLGPCVVTGVWDAEHWIYWVGPAGGAIVSVLVYRFIKVLEYEVANPGQDADEDGAEKEEGGKQDV